MVTTAIPSLRREARPRAGLRIGFLPHCSRGRHTVAQGAVVDALCDMAMQVASLRLTRCCCAFWMVVICCATTDSTSMSMRLNSSKQAQAPALSENTTGMCTCGGSAFRAHLAPSSRVPLTRGGSPLKQSLLTILSQPLPCTLPAGLSLTIP